MNICETGRKGSNYSSNEIKEMEAIAQLLMREHLPFSPDGVCVAIDKLKNQHVFGNLSGKNIFDKMTALSK